MGGPRPRSWVRVGLPLYFFLSGSWVGWILLGFLNAGSRWALFIFLSFWVLGRMGGPRPRIWALARFPSCFFLSGSWVGWVARGKEAGLPLGSLQRPKSWTPVGLPLFSFFLDSWVGWLGRGQEAGLALGSLHLFWAPLWMGGPRARVGLSSYCLSGLLAAPFMFPSFWAPGSGGPRSRNWTRIGLSSCQNTSVGRGQKLGSLHIAFLGPGSDGCYWAPFIFLCNLFGLFADII